VASLDEPIYLYVMGTAGSGKSKFTEGLKRWMIEHSHDAITVNLDPGAERLPYGPDVDIREWIVLSEVMDQYSLGPNGAQIVAADLIALQSPDVKDAINEFRTDYIIVDTPGQTELFVFREAGKIVMDFLGPGRSAIAFLVDPYLARRPSSFVTQQMLSATAQFRFGVPARNVLTKTDLLTEAQRNRIVGWGRNLDTLYEALVEDQADMVGQLNVDVFKVLEGMGAGSTDVAPVSSETLEGMDDVYTFLQGVFLGGEDLEKS
jgi:GTPase SAR1 family protein